MKFCFSVQKMKLGDMAAAKRHNKRVDKPSSQIDDPALWFTPKGHHSIAAWNDERVAKARSLMTRKDAVVGLEFVIQIGNQNDYRYSDGKPAKGQFAHEINGASNEILSWAEKQFGKQNIVSFDFHTDESTPHFHLVIAAIDNTPAPAPHPNAKNKKRPDDPERLNVKRWMTGRDSILQLRKTCHANVNKAFPCDYSSNHPDGGHPHDQSKSVASASKLKKLQAENAQLREQLGQSQEKIRELEDQLQNKALHNFMLEKLSKR